MYSYLMHLKPLLRCGRRLASNVTNVGNKPQITGAYSKGQPNRYPIPSKKMILRHCSPIMAESTTTQRPLTLIFGWMLAKDKHLEKYRQMWFRRGFDVLTVQTSPLDLLMPPIGGRIVAKNLVKYLSEIHSQYNEVVVHAFSVGGYQFGLTLYQLREDEEWDHILRSIKGVIYDSCVFPDGCAPGLSRAITRHPMVQPMIETSIHFFLRVFHNIVVKDHIISEQMFSTPLPQYQGLILYSSDDIVSGVEANEKLAQKWADCGSRVRTKCWTKSAHVLHYRDHQREYESEVDHFVDALGLKGGVGGAATVSSGNCCPKHSNCGAV